MTGKIVVITGASSGIGAALAREFSGRGATVVLLARRVERLQQLAAEATAAGRKLFFYPCDVTREADLKHVTELYRREVGPADIVIANAGFGVVGNSVALSVEDFRRQFETNVFGVLKTLHATFADLKATKGSFAVVGSVNGYLPLPGNSPYAMSKFAVRALCGSLREELAPLGISVTHIAPGFVRSEIRQVDNLGVHHPGARDVVPGWIQMPAAKAARQIASAVVRRRREIVVTFHGKFIVWFVRLFPGLLFKLIRVFRITARPEHASPE